MALLKMRTTNANKMIEDLWPCKNYLQGFDPKSWLDNPENIALEKEGNYTLYEHHGKGLYTAHIFFPTVKGRKAIDLAKEMLDHLFKYYPFILSLRGLTPLENRPARWLARQVGFSSQGPINWEGKWCELFVLTDEQFYNKQKEKAA